MVMFATVARCRFSEMTSRRSWSSCSSSSSKVDWKSSFVKFVCGLSKNDAPLLLLCSSSPLLKMSSERGTYACEDSLFIFFSFSLSLSLLLSELLAAHFYGDFFSRALLYVSVNIKRGAAASKRVATSMSIINNDTCER